MPDDNGCGHANDSAQRQTVERIWGYVRENKHSLDSERACRAIQSMVDTAVSAFGKRLDSALHALVVARAELASCRKKNRRLQTELGQLNTALAEATRPMDLLPGLILDKPESDCSIHV